MTVTTTAALSNPTSVQCAHALDAADPLAEYGSRYAPLDDRIHLAVAGRAARDTIGALRVAGLTDDWPVGPASRVPARTRASHAADAIAPLIGAQPGRVLLTADSLPVTTVRLAMAALRARPDRRLIVASDDAGRACLRALNELGRSLNDVITSDRLYQLHVIAAAPDGVTADQVATAVDRRAPALVVLPHAAYGTGAIADMAAITQAAHDAGALALWDLTHAAGVAPVHLADTGADLAVGATHTHLAAGPGAPAYLYTRDLDLAPCGQPSTLHASAALHGARLIADAGIDRIHHKAQSLTSYAIDLADAWLTTYGVQVTSPRDPHRRGAHVVLHHPKAGGITAALARIGVTVDHVAADRIRLTTHPLSTSYLDVHHALTAIRDILASRAHNL